MTAVRSSVSSRPRSQWINDYRQVVIEPTAGITTRKARGTLVDKMAQLLTYGVFFKGGGARLA